MSDFKTPEGWKLVPVEPTQEMMDAAFSGMVMVQSVTMQMKAIKRVSDQYKAMLAAAPTPPVHDENTSQERVRNQAEIEHEPFAHVHKRGSDDEEFVHAAAVNADCPDCEPLYLHPPAIRMPEPMTPYDIGFAAGSELAGLLDHICEYGTMSEGVMSLAVAFARAVEAEVLRRVMEANK